MKDLRERLAAQGVHTLIAQFTDLHGVAKGKFLPLAQIDALLTEGVSFTGASIEGSGLPRCGPRSEYCARGAASTAQPLPWMPGFARVVCDGFVEGEPYEACPRQELRRARERLAEHGWNLRLGLQPEFFLLRQHAQGWQPADAQDRLEQPSHDLRTLPRQSGFLQELQRALVECGVNVLQISHGDAPGQFELNFGFDEALASADRLMLFKQAGHALAEARQLVFSMMPKPYADLPGSAMNFHVSLWQGLGDNARNVFVPHRHDGAVDRHAFLSPLGQQFAAGVLAHAPALCALAAPTINSYKRLHAPPTRVGPGWAPTRIAHGPNNRTAVLRTLHDRFEWRMPDSSANPYLAAAALVAAGLDGIERKLTLPPACVDDLYLPESPESANDPARNWPRLPRFLVPALDALEADEAISEALGPVLTSEFVRLKRLEVAEYVSHVSDWEWQRYADRF